MAGLHIPIQLSTILASTTIEYQISLIPLRLLNQNGFLINPAIKLRRMAKPIQHPRNKARALYPSLHPPNRHKQPRHRH